MKNPIYSYLPEDEHAKRTEKFSTQVFTEACVLFDPQEHFKVIACQSEDVLVGKSVDEILGLDGEEASFLRERAFEHPLTLVCGSRRAAFVFSAFYGDTGLLFGIVTKGDPVAVCAAVAREEAFRAVLAPVAKGLAEAVTEDGAPLPAAWLSAAVCAVSGVLRHLHPTAPLSIEERTHWLASFAGSPVSMNLQAKDSEFPLLRTGQWTAFLLCLFYALQGEGGRLLFEDADKISASLEPKLSLEWRALRAEPNGDPISADALGDFPIFDFLRRPCFQSIGLLRTSRGILLRFRPEPAAKCVRALSPVSPSHVILLIRLQEE